MGDAPLILGFDTSGPWIGATLLRGTDAVADLHQDMPKGQGEHLFPLLEGLLDKAAVAWGDLDAVGVGVGPGNFTGIRISVSAARGLGLALDIPVVGVSLLEASAYGQPGPTLASVAAPRGQAYVQGFGTRATIAQHLIAVEDIPRDWAEPGLVLVGSASEAIEAHTGIARMAAVYAPGAAIARVAADRFGDAPPAPVPLYLRSADAAPSKDAPPVMLDDA